MIPTEEQIKAIVNWWGRQLFDPKFDNLNKQEKKNPANRPNIMAGMMAKMAADAHPVSGDQVELFKQALAARLRSLGDQPEYNFSCHVDYGPDDFLAKALEAAGLDTDSRLPWKSYTQIREDGSVVGRLSYGGEVQLLLEAVVI